MNKIDEAREYLINKFASEFSDYIREELAGDFAVILADQLKETKQCLLYVDPEKSCQALRHREIELSR